MLFGLDDRKARRAWPALLLGLLQTALLLLGVPATILAWRKRTGWGLFLGLACLCGLGQDRETALSQAAAVWITCVAGPIRSFLDGKPICMTCQAGVDAEKQKLTATAAKTARSRRPHGFFRIRLIAPPATTRRRR